MRIDPWRFAIGVIALGGSANALWMLAEPGHWYAHLPAGVPDTGPLNVHFVRDIGCAFLTASFALLWALRRPQVQGPLVAVAAFFYVTHAMLHVYDTARGFVDPTTGCWTFQASISRPCSSRPLRSTGGRAQPSQARALVDGVGRPASVADPGHVAVSTV